MHKISRSQLKLLASSPKLFYKEYFEGKKMFDSWAMHEGRRLHEFILEPDKFKQRHNVMETLCLPDDVFAELKGKSRSWKVVKQEQGLTFFELTCEDATKKVALKKIQDYLNDETLVLPDEFSFYKFMGEGIELNKEVAAALKQPSQKEVSFEAAWDEDLTLFCTIDQLVEQEGSVRIRDYKTTDHKITPRDYEPRLREQGIDMQMFIYPWILTKLGMKVDPWFDLILQNKKTAECIRLYYPLLPQLFEDPFSAYEFLDEQYRFKDEYGTTCSLYGRDLPCVWGAIKTVEAIFSFKQRLELDVWEDVYDSFGATVRDRAFSGLVRDYSEIKG